VTDFAPRRAAFRALHESGCFLMPNPWDIGTARYLAHLGFKALATTSSGFAFSRGLPDTDWAVPLEAALGHIAELVGATELPVNADFESAYAHEPEGVAANVWRCLETGVAGLSVEDATGDKDQPLYELARAVERIRADRAAIDKTGSGVVLTARAECYLVGHPEPLSESLRRLTAYAEAGADVLYAPGPRTKEEIEAIVRAVAPRPVNVLMGAHTGLTLADLAELGVRRISVGSGLNRAAWTGFIRAAEAMAAEGSFIGLSDIVPFAQINGFFRTDLAGRS
jgi:2-methylisocitrate lyase-like PEP mutase family enzyme